MAVLKSTTSTYRRKSLKKENSDKEEQTDLPIILSNRLYVPKSKTTQELLDAWTYTVDSGNSGAFDELNSEVEEFSLYKEFQDGQYYGFCRGDLDKIYSFFPLSSIVDERVAPRMPYKLTYTDDPKKQLRTHQVTAVDTWLEKRFGILSAAPRTGKTVMSCFISCKLQRKTLILVHTKDLADQFYATYQEFTNASDYENGITEKRQVVGIVRSVKDLENDWSVHIMTYQKFFTKMSTLKKLRDTWGLVIVDEAHHSSAGSWTKVLNILNAKYRMGLSATPKRKDQTHFIHYNILGPVTSVCKAKQMDCSVLYFKTGFVVKNFSMWTTLIRRLSEDEERNTLICDTAMKFADKGYNILITVKLVNHADVLASYLDKHGYTVATLTGKSPDRKALLKDIRSNKYQITVATRQLVQEGVDVPVWSCLIPTVPNMNPYAYQQEVRRVSTPYDGKPDPVIIIPVDDGHRVVHAMKAAFHKVHKQEGFYYYGDPNKRRLT